MYCKETTAKFRKDFKEIYCKLKVQFLIGQTSHDIVKARAELYGQRDRESESESEIERERVCVTHLIIFAEWIEGKNYGNVL